MLPITIGHDVTTNLPVTLHPDLFRTHFHMIGSTGSGKTNSIHIMLRPLMADPRPKSCIFVIDPMGGLSQDLLRWIANRRLCPQHVRDRLIYIEPAKENIVLPFNPLLHKSSDHLYYQVGRAVELMLRAWDSQDISVMPRLRQWTFNAFFSVAAMGYPISMCRFLLRPGTPEHEAMLRRLPPELQGMWGEILSARGSEAVRILESTRNRLAPFFDSGILRRMFGSTSSHFQADRFIRERRIVILNLASYERLDPHIGHTLGAMAVNEILRAARNLPPTVVDPTFVLLDEFQHFVTPDIYDALPTVRQMGLRLILAHQSLSQLEVGDIDLTGLIWQARSRLMFVNDAEDADQLAHELATLTYDPDQLKEVLYSRKQRIAGHRRQWLRSLSQSSNRTHSRGSQQQLSEGTKQGESEPRHEQGKITDQSGTTRGKSESDSETHGDGYSTSEAWGESLVPIHEDFFEVSSKTYFNFDEQRVLWAQSLRKRRTGEAYGKFKDDPKLYDLKIAYHPMPKSPASDDAVAKLLEQNFASPLFLSAAEVERQGEKLRRELLGEPPIDIQSDPESSAEDSPPDDPFVR